MTRPDPSAAEGLPSGGRSPRGCDSAECKHPGEAVSLWGPWGVYADGKGRKAHLDCFAAEEKGREPKGG